MPRAWAAQRAAGPGDTAAAAAAPVTAAARARRIDGRRRHSRNRRWRGLDHDRWEQRDGYRRGRWRWRGRRGWQRCQRGIDRRRDGGTRGLDCGHRRDSRRGRRLDRRHRRRDSRRGRFAGRNHRDGGKRRGCGRGRRERRHQRHGRQQRRRRRPRRHDRQRGNVRKRRHDRQRGLERYVYVDRRHVDTSAADQRGGRELHHRQVLARRGQTRGIRRPAWARQLVHAQLHRGVRRQRHAHDACRRP